jgi:hypothetical protein
MLSRQLREAIVYFPKHLITIYRNTETSEVDDEFESLKLALKTRTSTGAEIIHNAVVLAEVKPGDKRWKLTKAGEKMVSMETRGEEILRIPPGWNRG